MHMHMELNMMRLLVFILFLFSGHAAGDLISNVCKKTDYPSFCDATLRKFTGAPYADAKRLAQMMLVDGALDEVNAVYDLIIKQLQDPNIGELRKEVLVSCRLGFSLALNSDVEAVHAFDNGSYAEAARDVVLGVDAGSSCATLFKNAGLDRSPVPDGGLRHRQFAVVAGQLVKQLV